MSILGIVWQIVEYKISSKLEIHKNWIDIGETRPLNSHDFVVSLTIITFIIFMTYTYFASPLKDTTLTNNLRYITIYYMWSQDLVNLKLRDL